MYLVLILSITVMRTFCASSLGSQYYENPNFKHFLPQRQKHISKRSNEDVLRKLENATLKKCRCEGEEVWTGDSCQAASTYVAILDPQSGSRIPASTQEFGFVNVSRLRCSDTSQLLVTLDSNRQSEFPFSILPSGNLDWQQKEFQDYCVDHTLDHKGDPSSWEAWLCLSPPSLSHCCPPGHVLDTNGTCISGETSTFIPLIMLDDVYVNWTSFEDEKVAQLSCEEKSEILLVELGQENHHLVYYQGEAVLTWTPPAFPDSPKMHQNYCVGVTKSEDKGDKPSIYVAGLCYSDPIAAHQTECQGSTCVRKCCPENHWFAEGCEVVQEESQIWNPIFYSPEDISQELPAPNNLKVIHGYPLCQEYFHLDPQNSKDDRFYLMSDGLLNVPVYKQPFSSETYCLDNFLSTEGTAQTWALVCFHEDVSEMTSCSIAKEHVYPILMLVSCLFLGMTIVVYASIRELHDKLHGKCLLSLVSALFTGYMITVVVLFGTMPTVACRSLAFFKQFSFLAGFFWLNIMCFDIWRALRSMQAANTGQGLWSRFAKYSAYAWGCPFVISVATIIVETLPEKYDVIRPGFKTPICWFEKTVPMWAYFYGFVLALVIVNVIFFGLVIKILITAPNSSSFRRSRNYNRDRLWLYVKLFLVMGLTWLTEVISWQEGTCNAWIFTDIVNCLQGLIIFVIFVCKKSTRDKVRSKWCPSRTDSCDTTRTSNVLSDGTSTGHQMSLLTYSKTTPSSCVTSYPIRVNSVNADNRKNEESQRMLNVTDAQKENGIPESEPQLGKNETAHIPQKESDCEEREPETNTPFLMQNISNNERFDSDKCSDLTPNDLS